MKIPFLIFIAIALLPSIVILVVGITWEVLDHRQRKREEHLKQKGYFPIG